MFSIVATVLRAIGHIYTDILIFYGTLEDGAFALLGASPGARHKLSLDSRYEKSLRFSPNFSNVDLGNHTSDV